MAKPEFETCFNSWIRSSPFLRELIVSRQIPRLSSPQFTFCWWFQVYRTLKLWSQQVQSWSLVCAYKTRKVDSLMYRKTAHITFWNKQNYDQYMILNKTFPLPGTWGGWIKLSLKSLPSLQSVASMHIFFKFKLTLSQQVAPHSQWYTLLGFY
jgi:hypothetical protein